MILLINYYLEDTVHTLSLEVFWNPYGMPKGQSIQHELSVTVTEFSILEAAVTLLSQRKRVH